MKDSFRRPMVTLNVPLVRKERTEETYKLSVTFEETLDLKDILTYQGEDELCRYLSAYLFEHIYHFYWSERR